MILEGKLKAVMLICEAVVMTACWIVSYTFPSLNTEYTREGNYLDTLFGLFIVSVIVYIMVTFHNNVLRKEEESKNLHRLFDQTTQALVNSIEMKDKYTQGHSARVAEYSRKIARMSGKSEAECEEIYYVALLHDVGKIGIDESILNKPGKLTEDEYMLIKNHTVIGARILSCITEYPFLSIGAQYHHERYDGKGYPEGLKGTDIPEVARIIAVAEAYDSMSSKRSYHDPLPQQKVREELIEGTGTQFDPEFAKIMLHMLDLDTEYEMQEREDTDRFAGKDDFIIDAHRSVVSEGIFITEYATTVHMKVSHDTKAMGRKPMPSIVIFDSLDGRYHSKETEEGRRNAEELLYYEYCEIFFDGRVEEKGSRKVEARVASVLSSDVMAPGEYRIEAVKIGDHVLFRITGREIAAEVTVALPDKTRYVYVGLTGEACRISGVRIEKADKPRDPGFIRRIADEITFIDGPVGDVPNVQIDGYRTASTDGIRIDGSMKISFHARSLPTARLVWHCPYFVIFSSDNGKVSGDNYVEYSLLRLDGETWDSGSVADNNLMVDRMKFNGWDEWKSFNKEGYDCSVTFERENRKIVFMTSNGGISIKNITTINTDVRDIYVAITGDQCALTDIHIE
ncbi:MAG: HD-GYP domain-containing protein [Lachnospiraceae bacterium]|nr:HD-GYP domain-containing protein [Lachnospiraceae bacterium]